jgi:aminomethyltransferase
MAALGKDETADAALERTALHALHAELGAKFVPFAGYEMPVQYKGGVLREHLHTRASAGLFDVSHMGQAFVIGPDHQRSAAALEALVPGDIANLAPGRMRYTMLLNADGGIIDDVMVTRSAAAADDGTLLLVVNAARKEVDLAHIAAHLPGGVTVAPAANRALIALQGPRACDVLQRHCPQAAGLAFMSATAARFDDVDCHISRSGYSGEDGFEISLEADAAERLARALLAEAEVAVAGLGARDTLRLEAGLCLYGADIDETTSPIEADLGWAIARRRRENGDFPGAKRILGEIAGGPSRRRVGIRPEGKAPVRAGVRILLDGRDVGTITSGGYGPTVSAPIAMGYVEIAAAAPGTRVELPVRGRTRQAEVADLPLVPHRYFKPAP